MYSGKTILRPCTRAKKILRPCTRAKKIRGDVLGQISGRAIGDLGKLAVGQLSSEAMYLGNKNSVAMNSETKILSLYSGQKNVYPCARSKQLLERGLTRSSWYSGMGSLGQARTRANYQFLCMLPMCSGKIGFS